MPGGLAFGASASGASRWRVTQNDQPVEPPIGRPRVDRLRGRSDLDAGDQVVEVCREVGVAHDGGLCLHMAMDAPEDEIPVCAYPLPPNGRSSAPVGLQP